MSETLLRPAEHRQLFSGRPCHTLDVRRHAQAWPARKTRGRCSGRTGRGARPASRVAARRCGTRRRTLWEWWHIAGYEGRGRPSCYATSRDGVEWDASPLGLFEIDGSRDNNVAGDPDARRLYHILRDERDDDPARRYKGLFDSRDRWLGTSPDGFDWTMLDVSPIPSQDESHFIYDEYTEQFLAFVKQPTEWGRSVYLATSADFERFTFPRLVFNTDETDNDNRMERIRCAVDGAGYLTPPVIAAAGVLGGAVLPDGRDALRGPLRRLPVIYNPAGPDGLGNDTAQPGRDDRLARLYDWDRVADREVFIGIEPWDGVNYGTAQNLLCGRPIVRGGEIWVYYNALRIRDNKELYWERDRYGFIDRDLFDDHSALHLGKLRLDGFVSLDAEVEGHVVTEPFDWSGRDGERQRGRPGRASRRVGRRRHDGARPGLHGVGERADHRRPPGGARRLEGRRRRGRNARASGSRCATASCTPSGWSSAPDTWPRAGRSQGTASPSPQPSPVEGEGAWATSRRRSYVALGGGAAEYDAALDVVPDRQHLAAVPVSDPPHYVAAGLQVGRDRLRYPALGDHVAGVRLLREEGRREVARPHGRRVERLLHVHAELDVVQEELQRHLLLAVAARRAEDHVRLPVACHERRRERRPGALARLQRVGPRRVQVEHLPPRPDRGSPAPVRPARRAASRRSASPTPCCPRGRRRPGA